MVYEFREGSGFRADFQYAYSPACRTYPEFAQEENCVANRLDNTTGKYEYISMITKKGYAPGAAFSARCSFESYGAPLIVLADGLSDGKDGIARYKSHFEIVAYEGGVNVWHIVPEGGGVKPENLARKKFPVKAGQILLLTVETGGNGIAVSLGDKRFKLSGISLPARFRAGITACEGINRFYEFTVLERYGKDQTK